MRTSGRDTLVDKNNSFNIQDVNERGGGESLTKFLKRNLRLPTRNTNSTNTTPQSNNGDTPQYIDMGQLVKSVHSLGFGKLYFGHGEKAAAMIGIPSIEESLLRADPHYPSYSCGSFTNMVSRVWLKTRVTVRRLVDPPPEGAAHDLLIAELEVRCKLQHPQLLLLMGVCQTHNLESLSLVFEHVQLGSLYYCLHQKKVFIHLKTIVDILLQMVDAITFLHARKWLHSAITSHAVQLVSAHVAKLSCLEYLTGDDANEQIRNRSRGCSIQDPKHLNVLYPWLAPEVLEGKPITQASDIYSLCCVMWELCTGEVPWDDLTLDAVENQLLVHRVHLPLSKNMPSFLYHVMSRGLQLDLEHRDLDLNETRDMLIMARKELLKKEKARESAQSQENNNIRRRSSSLLKSVNSNSSLQSAAVTRLHRTLDGIDSVNGSNNSITVAIMDPSPQINKSRFKRSATIGAMPMKFNYLQNRQKSYGSITDDYISNNNASDSDVDSYTGLRKTKKLNKNNENDCGDRIPDYQKGVTTIHQKSSFPSTTSTTLTTSSSQSNIANQDLDGFNFVANPAKREFLKSACVLPDTSNSDGYSGHTNGLTSHRSLNSLYNDVVGQLISPPSREGPARKSESKEDEIDSTMRLYDQPRYHTRSQSAPKPISSQQLSRSPNKKHESAIKPASHRIEHHGSSCSLGSPVISSSTSSMSNLLLSSSHTSLQIPDGAGIKPAGHALCREPSFTKKLRESYPTVPQVVRDAVIPRQRFYSQPGNFQRVDWNPTKRASEMNGSHFSNDHLYSKNIENGNSTHYNGITNLSVNSVISSTTKPDSPPREEWSIGPGKEGFNKLVSSLEKKKCVQGARLSSTSSSSENHSARTNDQQNHYDQFEEPNFQSIKTGDEHIKHVELGGEELRLQNDKTMDAKALSITRVDYNQQITSTPTEKLNKSSLTTQYDLGESFLTANDRSSIYSRSRSLESRKHQSPRVRNNSGNYVPSSPFSEKGFITANEEDLGNSQEQQSLSNYHSFRGDNNYKPVPSQNIPLPPAGFRDACQINKSYVEVNEFDNQEQAIAQEVNSARVNVGFITCGKNSAVSNYRFPGNNVGASGSSSKQSLSGIEDFYIDDEFNPNLSNESHMQLIITNSPPHMSPEDLEFPNKPLFETNKGRESPLSMEVPSTGPASLQSELSEESVSDTYGNEPPYYRLANMDESCSEEDDDQIEEEESSELGDVDEAEESSESEDRKSYVGDTDGRYAYNLGVDVATSTAAPEGSSICINVDAYTDVDDEDNVPAVDATPLLSLQRDGIMESSVDFDQFAAGISHISDCNSSNVEKDYFTHAIPGCSTTIKATTMDKGQLNITYSKTDEMGNTEIIDVTEGNKVTQTVVLDSEF